MGRQGYRMRKYQCSGDKAFRQQSQISRRNSLTRPLGPLEVRWRWSRRLVIRMFSKNFASSPKRLAQCLVYVTILPRSATVLSALLSRKNFVASVSCCPASCPAALLSCFPFVCFLSVLLSCFSTFLFSCFPTFLLFYFPVYLLSCFSAFLLFCFVLLLRLFVSALVFAFLCFALLVLLAKKTKKELSKRNNSNTHLKNV